MTKEIILDEETHTYTYGDQELMSSTEWRDQFFKPFDTKRISRYYSDACTREIVRWSKKEELLTPDNFPKCSKLFQDSWKEEVRERKGRTTKKVTAAEVQEAWNQKGTDAADEGTRIHNLIEEAIKGELSYLDYIEEQLVVEAINYIGRLRNVYGYNSLLHPEKIIGGVNHETEEVVIPIAGMIDLMIEYEPGKVILVDWKTNDNIYKEGYNKGIAKSTQDLEDSKLNKYTLQLSLYAYLLEEFYDKEVTGLYIAWLANGQCEPIEVEYAKERIMEMLKEDGQL